MEETEGSCRKKRKKTVNETHDDSTLLSQENVSVQPSSRIITLSEAAYALDADTVLNQLAGSSAANCHAAAAFKPLSAAAEVMVTNGTQGAVSNHSLSNDEAKAQSSVDSNLIDVEGYCVKKEVASMLQRIFDKHKDIARECKIKNRTLIVSILEMISSFCQKLEDTSFTESEDLTLIVESFQHMGFNVEWLSGRLKDISKAKQCKKDLLALKEVNTKIMIKEKEVGILKQKLSTEEAELAMMKVERDKAERNYKQQRNALELNGFVSWHKSVLNGLI